MRKIILPTLLLIGLTACSKPDPILPGVRTSLLLNTEPLVLDKTALTLPENITPVLNNDCPYTQDNSNIIWAGNKKIFSGFPSSNFVNIEKRPVCNGNFVYAGLTTGEVIKINPKSRDIKWVAEVFQNSTMTGGSTILDIVATIAVHGDFVYAGGIGDAFCKLSDSNGSKKWCVNIGTDKEFIIAGDFAFIVGTDSNLYAINTDNGDIFWRSPVDEIVTPVYKNKTIIVDDEIFDAETGKNQE